MPETTTTGTTQKPLKKKFKGGKQATQKKRPAKKDKRTEKAPVVVAVKTFTPAFLYISECCDVPGKKEPLVWSAKDKEENKCILLCANCHRIHHWEERHGILRQGSKPNRKGGIS